MLSIFLTALIAVAVLLLVAVPGFLFVRTKLMSESTIPALSKILIYLCQPCLAVYTFTSTPFSVEKLKSVGLFALLCLAINGVMLAGAYLILRRKCEQPIYRIVTVATTFGNCAFFGIPIIEALMPDVSADLIIYTTVYAVIMNILGWTVGSAIIARDARYMSLRQSLLNPAVIGAAVALIIFVGRIPIHPSLVSMITATARMATPLSMIIMGMRLATVDIRSLLKNGKIYAAVAVKQIFMPLLAFAFVLFLPLDIYIKRTFFVICACPVASIVLNYAEIVGAGQREAAGAVLFGTAISILTLPVMMLLYPLLG